MNVNQITQSFQAEMLLQQITPPENIQADAQLHRFYIPGDNKCSKNGWYILYPNNIPCGIFGNWKEGLTHKWSAKQNEYMSVKEFTEFRQKIAEATQLRDVKRAHDQQKAAKLAEKLFHSYQPANSSFPYLVRKKIQPFCAKQFGGELVIPIVNFYCELKSLQYISANGSKRFLTDGAIKGNFILVQGNYHRNVQLLICEGFATGASLAHAYPKACVIAACNAGNLKPVAVLMRQQLPKAKIIICADDDRLTPDNPGINKGREAAIASESLFAKPNWPHDAPTHLTDFNDLVCWQSVCGVVA